jgi:hypothetical protein
MTKNAERTTRISALSNMESLNSIQSEIAGEQPSQLVTMDHESSKLIKDVTKQQGVHITTITEYTTDARKYHKFLGTHRALARKAASSLLCTLDGSGLESPRSPLAINFMRYPAFATLVSAMTDARQKKSWSSGTTPPDSPVAMLTPRPTARAFTAWAKRCECMKMRQSHLETALLFWRKNTLCAVLKAWTAFRQQEDIRLTQRAFRGWVISLCMRQASSMLAHIGQTLMVPILRQILSCWSKLCCSLALHRQNATRRTLDSLELLVELRRYSRTMLRKATCLCIAGVVTRCFHIWLCAHRIWVDVRDRVVSRLARCVYSIYTTRTHAFTCLHTCTDVTPATYKHTHTALAHPSPSAQGSGAGSAA